MSLYIRDYSQYIKIESISHKKHWPYHYHARDDSIVMSLDHNTCVPHIGHGRLTHCGRVTHICVSKRAIIGSDNGLSPSRRQAIIWTNAEILLIRPSGTNFSETLIEIDVFSFKKMHL